MRLWSIHPQYLDRQGLLACWREGLLAQKVLQGKTKGYQNHPQLLRFKKLKDPLAGIGAFLFEIVLEATRREYKFDSTKIIKNPKLKRPIMPVTDGQIEFESIHLLKKLKQRSPAMHKVIIKNKDFKSHPIFKIVPGEVEVWEKV